jgi:hypothetical protein
MKVILTLSLVLVALLATVGPADAYPGNTCWSSLGCGPGETCMVMQAGRPGTCVRARRSAPMLSIPAPSERLK